MDKLCSHFGITDPIDAKTDKAADKVLEKASVHSSRSKAKFDKPGPVQAGTTDGKATKTKDTLHSRRTSSHSDATAAKKKNDLNKPKPTVIST